MKDTKYTKGETVRFYEPCSFVTFVSFPGTARDLSSQSGRCMVEDEPKFLIAAYKREAVEF
jgi:hypothetical protein